eukprot:TRINITY_DN1411_c0_g1_i1.p1 TRINITY_DN1411_c0_g1~~TRINITY_DN1411_c0_g1_i1.p1  ORF type:complete len:389 (+),score=57.66 TRINITY_DN1411_c0_g1_i1:45-1169(+)
MSLFHALASRQVFTPFIAVTWLVSGLVTNLVQLLVFVTVYPFSKKWCRIITAKIAYFWWCIPIWIVDWWSRTEIRINYNGDIKKLGTENAVILCNHTGDVDWLMGWILAERHGTLGTTKAYMKMASKYLPILGWSWYFVDYIFISRDWNKDKTTLAKTFNTLNDYPSSLPFWIALFCEGTRQTPKKLAESQQWCRDNNKPVLKNLLWPRTKGFVSTVQGLPDKLDAVYMFAINLPDKEKEASFANFLGAKESSVSLQIRRWGKDELPSDEEGLKEFCTNVYMKLDEDISTAAADGHFPGTPVDLRRNIMSRVSAYFWTTLVHGGLGMILYTSPSVAVIYFIVGLYVVMGLGLIGMIAYAETGAKKKKKVSKKDD